MLRRLNAHRWAASYTQARPTRLTNDEAGGKLDMPGTNADLVFDAVDKQYSSVQAHFCALLSNRGQRNAEMRHVAQIVKTDQREIFRNPHTEAQSGQHQ